MKKYFYLFGRKLFLKGLTPYTENEKRGIKLAFRFLLKHPGALSVMLITGLIAAVFEGGTLGWCYHPLGNQGRSPCGSRGVPQAWSARRRTARRTAPRS